MLNHSSLPNRLNNLSFFSKMGHFLVVLSVLFLWFSGAKAGHFHNRTKWKKKGNNCNMYDGSWVYDNSYPVYYDSSSCPFIRKEFDCLKYGRPDRLYLKFRWQPKNCDLPRFNGQEFLRRHKDKKLMFIGDSLSLNNWQSLVCLLHAAVPHSTIVKDITSSISSVTFKDYGVSVMYFRTPYLVDIEEEQNGRILKLDSLKNGDIWKKMDILVFNTWLWWYRKGPKQPWDYIQDGQDISKDMDRMTAFHKGLMSWASWVDAEVDPTKTKVLFQGISPSHYNGFEWNEPEVKNCSKETQPIMGSTYPAGLPQAATVVKGVLDGIKKPVHLLDITTLSQLRKDAHPSSYNGFRGMDCTHWCIAGLPDTWNELLYAALIN